MNTDNSSAARLVPGAASNESAGLASGKTETCPAENPFSKYVYMEIAGLIQGGSTWENAVNSALEGLCPLQEIKRLIEVGYSPQVAVMTTLALDTDRWKRRCESTRRVA